MASLYRAIGSTSRSASARRSFVTCGIGIPLRILAGHVLLLVLKVTAGKLGAAPAVFLSVVSRRWAAVVARTCLPAVCYRAIRPAWTRRIHALTRFATSVVSVQHTATGRSAHCVAPVDSLPTRVRCSNDGRQRRFTRRRQRRLEAFFVPLRRTILINAKTARSASALKG